MYENWTQNNHLKFGYNDEWFNHHYSNNDRFHVGYGTVDPNNVGTWREEHIRAAKLIRASTDKPICIMMSGGMDAELAAAAFIEAGIEFSVATLEFNDPYRNSHETICAKKFCERFGIEQTMYELDLDDFLEDALDYAKQSRIFEGFRATKFWLADQIVAKGYYPIIGQGELYMLRGSEMEETYKADLFKVRNEYEDDKWYLVEKESVFGWNKHFLSNDIEGCPAFFQYTPEQMYSFLLDPTTISLVNQSEIKTNEFYKMVQYSSAFDIITDDRDVYGGLENYSRLNEMVRKQYYEMADHFGYRKYVELLLFEYEELLTMLNNGA